MTGSTSLRIVVVAHMATMGGAEIALVRLLRNVDRERFHVTVVLFSDGPLVQELQSNGIPVRIVLLDPHIASADRHDLTRLRADRVGSAIRLASFVLVVRRLIAELDPDVVHCNSLKADLIGGVAARLARRRVVWYLHDRISDDYLPGPVASIIRLLARHIPHQVLANSKATLATMQPLPPERSVVAYPGLERAEFKLRRTEPNQRPLIGIVGRISPTKGQDVFLRAAAMVLQDHPQTAFAVVGGALFNEGDFEREVRGLAVRLGIGEQVRFTGHVSDVAKEMAQFTAVVHASPVPEPFGQVIVEAMAIGVPVIATRGGGAEEITGADGELALVVPPADPGALAIAMRGVLDDPAAATRRAERALASVIGRFEIDATVTTVTTIWLRAAHQR